MLRIRGLRVSFSDKEILKGIDLDLERGESIAIVGESGAGKTTLGLCIMGLSSGRCSGEIRLMETDLFGLSEKDYRRLRGNEIAMVFQNVEDALDPVQRVQDQIIEAITIHSSGRCQQTDIKKLLHSVGLGAEKARAYPHQLSGGERQRVLIAMALANDPWLLILDEPTASLDAITKADIVGLLRSALARRISIVITHDISLAAALTKKTAVLYAGMIVELGPTEKVLKNPLHPYTRGLIRSYPSMITTKDLQGIPGRTDRHLDGCPFHQRCTQMIDMCRKEIPKLMKAGGGSRLVACHRGGIVPLLETRNLCKKFNSFYALNNLDLTLYEGETLALVGESGSGKTTLSKVIMGIYNQDSGEVFLESLRVNKRDMAFYSRVQLIFQNPRESISHRMNVMDVVLEPLVLHRKGTKEEMTSRAKEVLDLVELPSDYEFVKRYPHQLSGGEVQRVAIARALALGPKLLIADEPTSSLDPSVQAKIMKLLLNLQDKMGLGMLFITHDIALARKVSDRVAIMLRGQIVETGRTDEIMSCPEHNYTRRLIDCASGRCDKAIEAGVPASSEPVGDKLLAAYPWIAAI